MKKKNDRINCFALHKVKLIEVFFYKLQNKLWVTLQPNAPAHQHSQLIPSQSHIPFNISWSPCYPSIFDIFRPTTNVDIQLQRKPDSLSIQCLTNRWEIVSKLAPQEGQ